MRKLQRQEVAAAAAATPAAMHLKKEAAPSCRASLIWETGSEVEACRRVLQEEEECCHDGSKRREEEVSATMIGQALGHRNQEARNLKPATFRALSISNYSNLKPS
jgi:hypothetical protein